MTRRISLVNFKGGVGKTSLTVNLAACLAHEFGQRVLLVDCDAQSNSSIWLMGAANWSILNEKPQNTIYGIFMNQNVVNPIHLNVVKGVSREDGAVAIPTLDLLPATYSLMDLEHEYKNAEDFPYFLRFNLQISQFFNSYDYILFDCPPNVFRASKCALFSSEEIYIPCNADILSYVGLTLLNQKIDAFQKQTVPYHSLAQDYRLAQIRGIILNAMRGTASYDTVIKTMEAWIHNARSSNAVDDNAEVLPRVIRHSVSAGRAVQEHKPAILCDGFPSLTDDYIKLAEYIHHKPLRRTTENQPIFKPNKFLKSAKE